METKYSAVILSRDTSPDLTKCLQSLDKQTCKPETILLYIRKAPYASDFSVKEHIKKSGVDLSKYNVIIEWNAQTESGWDLNVTPPYEASCSMARMRNKCIEMLKGDNILWIDADMQFVSTDGVDQLMAAHSKSKLGENVLFAAPVRKSMWLYESMIREYNPVSGAACHRMHISPQGPMRFNAYTTNGLCQSARDMAEYSTCDVAGSLVYMPKEFIENFPEPFQCQIFGEWAGLQDQTECKFVVVRDVQNIHRSNRSHS